MKKGDRSQESGARIRKPKARSVTVMFTIKLNPPDKFVSDTLAQEIEKATLAIRNIMMLASAFQEGPKP